MSATRNSIYLTSLLFEPSLILLHGIFRQETPSDGPVAKIVKIDFPGPFSVDFVKRNFKIGNWASPFLENVAALLEFYEAQSSVIIWVNLCVDLIILQILLQTEQKPSKLLESQKTGLFCSPRIHRKVKSQLKRRFPAIRPFCHVCVAQDLFQTLSCL